MFFILSSISFSSRRRTIYLDLFILPSKIVHLNMFVSSLLEVLLVKRNIDKSRIFRFYPHVKVSE